MIMAQKLSSLFIDRLWKTNPAIHSEYVFLQICADSYFILGFLLFMKTSKNS